MTISRKPKRVIRALAPIEEIWAIRRRLLRKAGGTTEGYLALIRKLSSEVSNGRVAKTRKRKPA